MGGLAGGWPGQCKTRVGATSFHGVLMGFAPKSRSVSEQNMWLPRIFRGCTNTTGTYCLLPIAPTPYGNGWPLRCRHGPCHGGAGGGHASCALGHARCHGGTAWGCHAPGTPTPSRRGRPSLLLCVAGGRTGLGAAPRYAPHPDAQGPGAGGRIRGCRAREPVGHTNRTRVPRVGGCRRPAPQRTQTAAAGCPRGLARDGGGPSGHALVDRCNVTIC